MFKRLNNTEVTLTWDFIELIHELVLQLGKGLVLLTGPWTGHVGGVGASRGGGGGGWLGCCRRQRFPSTLTHCGDAGKPGRCWKGGERETQWVKSFLFFAAVADACQRQPLTS